MRGIHDSLAGLFFRDNDRAAPLDAGDAHIDIFTKHRRARFFCRLRFMIQVHRDRRATICLDDTIVVSRAGRGVKVFDRDLAGELLGFWGKELREPGCCNDEEDEAGSQKESFRIRKRTLGTPLLRDRGNIREPGDLGSRDAFHRRLPEYRLDAVGDVTRRIF